MSIKERIEIEAKAYAFGDQNEHRTFLAGADFYRKSVVEVLEQRKKELMKYDNEDSSNLVILSMVSGCISELARLIKLLKS